MDIHCACESHRRKPRRSWRTPLTSKHRSEMAARPESMQGEVLAKCRRRCRRRVSPNWDYPSKLTDPLTNRRILNEEGRPWLNYSFPSYAYVGIHPLAVRKGRQKAAKETKNRKTRALTSVKNSVVRPTKIGAPQVLRARALLLLPRRARP